MLEPLNSFFSNLFMLEYFTIIFGPLLFSIYFNL